MTVKEILEKRANLVEQARDIHKAAEKDGRDLTAEEEANIDSYLDEAEDLAEEAESRRQKEQRTKRLETIAGEIEKQPRRTVTEPDPLEDRENRQNAEPDKDEIWKRGWEASIRYEPEDMTPEQRQWVNEARALQADLDVSGGYLTAPPQFNAELIEAVRDDVIIGDLSRSFNIPGTDTVQWPVLDTRPDDPDRRGETEAATADSSTAFGFREFTPERVTKVVLLSEKLLRTAALPIEEIMIDLYRYEFASTFESWFMTGTGADQPLGVFTAATNGISTSRDVSTDNTTTEFTADGLKRALYSLKAQYQRRAVWIFHRDAVRLLATLKDGNGNYLWEPSNQASQPSRLWGVPLRMSEFAPNTFTSGLYVGIIGDFSQYYVFRFLGGATEFRRYSEYLTADLGATGQVGIRATQYIDAGPVLEEGFARVTLA